MVIGKLAFAALPLLALTGMSDDRPVTLLEKVYVRHSISTVPRCLSRFVNYPPGPGVLGFPRCLFENPFPPNPDFWLKGIDFTSVSPWNDTHGSQRAGTAISKRHIILAKHYPLASGTRIAFVGENGDTSHYTVKATKELSQCDILIGLLDYELTPDVHPAVVLPDNFDVYLSPEAHWPVVTFNQREEVVLSELSITTNFLPGVTRLQNTKSKSILWQKFGKPMIGGDSGNPAFLLYGKQPILLYCLQFGGVGEGPFIHACRKNIQEAMDGLCPGYKLEAYDFGAIDRHD